MDIKSKLAVRSRQGRFPKLQVLQVLKEVSLVRRGTIKVCLVAVLSL